MICEACNVISDKSKIIKDFEGMLKKYLLNFERFGLVIAMRVT